MTADSFQDLERFSIPYKDKYVHFTFYFVFTLLWVFSLKPFYGNTYKVRFSVFAVAVLYGGLIEVCQGLFTVSRGADITDVLANTTGSAMAVLMLWRLNKK